MNEQISSRSRVLLAACVLALAVAALAVTRSAPAASAPPVPACAAAPAETPPPGFFTYNCVNLRGISMGYREAGQGPPLVLISGFGATAGEWDPALIDQLTPHNRVIAPDNRGVGTSTTVRGLPLTIGQMADDTAALIRKLGLRRANVLGWSMGGFIAQKLVVRYPRLVNRLILAATDPGSPRAVQAKPWATKILNNPASTPVDYLPLMFPKDEISSGSAWYGRIAADLHYMPPQALTLSPAMQRRQVLASGKRWYRPGRGAYARLPRIRQRTLVADGSLDILEPPPNSRMIARRIPRAQLKIYPGAGHGFPVQYSGRFARRINRFLP